MFRRHWSGLPKDPSFPADLKGLGYFINDEDEIRSTEDPDCYFKFFLNRNPRINERQRFAFNQALEMVIHERLENEGLQKVTLPLGSTAEDRHVPIFVSPCLMFKSRVVVIFGEPTQDLGLLAGRVASGPGGIDKGSMVSVVRVLQTQASSDVDPSPPGIVLANTGQLYWWPEGKRGVTVSASTAIPLPSIVHHGRRHVPALNNVPGSEDPTAHVRHVFDEVLRKITQEAAKVSVVAIGESCEIVTKYLDDEKNWLVWQDRLSSLLLLGSVYPDDELTNESFKHFLAKASRTRAYATSAEPLDAPLAPPTGNPDEGVPNLGCPCYSSAEPHHAEVILISALGPALGYLETVAMTPDFENPPIAVPERPEPEFTEQDWGQVPEEEKPLVTRWTGEK
ncbi:Arb2 domain-containing protein [Tolypocladium capitatum]|uniref:Arb2 domain-containing protein n=1 Tax=Tolypocladium capitatum TaxID=45235 RepID=A0A2K3Q5L9_9HYPO|nr:Arb2 domain-containing protein [Tolypocladium capitatum]